MNKNTKRIFKIIIAATLAILMGLLTPAQAIAYSKAEEHLMNTPAETLENELKNNKLAEVTGATKFYVKEVMLASGNTEAEAKNALHAKGFLVYDNNLNENTTAKGGGQPKFSYLGYKITTDPDKAITDLSLMDQDGGYDKFNYIEYAEKHMTGIESLAQGMHQSCRDMSAKLALGSKPASVAKAYLDLFYVPDSIRGTVGPRLGDYLLDPKRTDDEYKYLILMLNTVVLNVINAMLMLAQNETTIIPQTANGGKTADGKFAATYTTYNGITGYKELVDGGNWLKTAADKMVKDAEFANVNKTEESSFFADLSATFGAQGVLVKQLLEKGGISNAAIEYLKSVTLESTGGKISEALGMGSAACTAYDLLTRGSNRMLCLYFSFMSDFCRNNAFLDVLEISATDYKHRIPKDFTTDKKLDINWAEKAVATIEAELENPSDKSEMEPYNADIDSFILFMQKFSESYKKALNEYRKQGGKIVLPEGMSEEQGDAMIVETIESQKEVSDLHYSFYLTIRDLFGKYKVSDGNVSLIDYLYYAVDGKSAASEEVRRKVFPVVKALGTARMYSIKANSMVSFLLSSVSSEYEVDTAACSLDKNRMDLEDGYESKNLNVWVGSNKDLAETGDYVAMTSERVLSNMSAYKSTNFSNELPMTKKLESAMVKVAIAAGAAIIAYILLPILGDIIFSIASLFISSLTALLTMGISAWSMFALACSAIATTVLPYAFVIIIIVFAVLFILYIIELSKPEPDPVYTDIPTIMLDCVENKNGDITGVSKYYVVRDQNGKPADMKTYNSRKWLALYYTRDKNAGSPLTLGPDNSFFVVKTAQSSTPDKAFPLSKFLRTSAYNINNNSYTDRGNGKFIFYYTEDSLNGINPDALKGKYIDSIMIAHSNNDEYTKLFLEKTQGYSVLSETNISPGCAYNTYVAYHTTNNAKEAITDIRVAYGTAAGQIFYGDAEYSNVMSEGMRQIPAMTCEETVSRRQKTAFSYSVYTTKSEFAGDPILADSFSYATVLSNVDKDYEFVSYFAGVPVDFNAPDKEEYQNFDNHYYLCFKQENAKKSNTDYLAGFAFFSGSDDWNPECKENNLEKYATMAYGCTLLTAWNLTPGLYHDYADKTYLGYLTTRNPKRAVTEISSFTGEPKNGNLPQNIASGTTGYCACEIFTQGDFNYYGSGGGYRQRVMRISHGYFTIAPTEQNGIYWNDSENLVVLPRGLYCAGGCKDVEPIEAADVLIGHEASPPSTIFNNSSLFPLTKAKSYTSLSSPVSGDNWQSVHPIDKYYYDEYDARGQLVSSFDLGLGMNKSEDISGNGHFYMYYKNSKPVRRRGNYVSNIALKGSISPNAPYDTARILALSGGEEIINIDNPITLTDRRFETVGTNSVTYTDIPRLLGVTPVQAMGNAYDSNCFFVSVTYSDLVTNSVRSVRVMKQNKGEDVLSTAQKLPLYGESSVMVDYFQSSMVITSGEEGTDQYGKAKYDGYVMYKSASGTSINRVDVRFVNTRPGQSRSESWSRAGSGVAEYYVPLDDTAEPFLFNNYGNGTAACICLQSYELDEKGQNKDKYILDVALAESLSYDGGTEMAAVKLGAMGYPYAIDFDVTESALSKDSNVVATLGIKRTDSPKHAIKDIKVSSDNLGKTFDANGIRYQLVNETPIKLSGIDPQGVYLYKTYGSSSDTILWSTVDKKNTDWEKFDWFSLDLADAGRDPEFHEIQKKYYSTHPGMGEIMDKFLKEKKKRMLAERGLRADWEEKMALTNIGFAPASGNAEQTLRKFNGTAKSVYWAGCSAFNEDKLIVPVTSDTKLLPLNTFGSVETPIGICYTNMGNTRFEPFKSNANEDTLAGSIFGNRNVMIIIILSAVSLLALAGAYIIYRKKQKKETLQ